MWATERTNGMDGHGAVDDAVKALEQLSGSPLQRNDNDDVVPSGQRQCPICDSVMRVEAHGDIAIDVCPAHGIWLDNGELEQLLRVAAGRDGRINVEAIRRARQDGKISGALLGVWSLLLP
jgi:Zn-finger nucleic acid-binding protein